MKLNDNKFIYMSIKYAHTRMRLGKHICVLTFIQVGKSLPLEVGTQFFMEEEALKTPSQFKAFGFDAKKTAILFQEASHVFSSAEPKLLDLNFANDTVEFVSVSEGLKLELTDTQSAQLYVERIG